MAASLGHLIAEIGPALAPLVITDFPFTCLAVGDHLSRDAVLVWRKNRKIAGGEGDVLFTHTGGLVLVFSIVPARSGQEK